MDANIVFAEMPSRMIEGLHAAGFGFFAMHGWARLVTSFNTNDEVVALFIETAKHFGQAQ